jgi:hypothetical protein
VSRLRDQAIVLSNGKTGRDKISVRLWIYDRFDRVKVPRAGELSSALSHVATPARIWRETCENTGMREMTSGPTCGAVLVANGQNASHSPDSQAEAWDAVSDLFLVLGKDGRRYAVYACCRRKRPVAVRIGRFGRQSGQRQKALLLAELFKTCAKRTSISCLVTMRAKKRRDRRTLAILAPTNKTGRQCAAKIAVFSGD